MIKPNQIIRYKKQLGKAIHCYDDKKPILRFHPLNYGRYWTKDLEIIDLKFVEETTRNEKIFYIERDCPWGRIVKTHCIGNFQIMEYHDDKQNETGFSIYIDFVSASLGASTLDVAILCAICKKYKSSDAAKWVLKMLEMKDE